MTTCSKGRKLHWWKLFIVNHLLEKFGGCRHHGSRGITDLIFKVTLQEHVIKEPCDFVERSSLLYIPTLQSLVTIGIVVEEM